METPLLIPGIGLLLSISSEFFHIEQTLCNEAYTPRIDTELKGSRSPWCGSLGLVLGVLATEAASLEPPVTQY